MSSYYTVIMILAVFSMLAMLVCVNSSGTLTRSKKRYSRLLFICVSIAAFCEWFGIYLQGTGNATRVLHIVVKLLELTLAPTIGFLIAEVIEEKNKTAILLFLSAHGVLEILSAVLGFIYQVDANSTYTHAKFYWIYVVAYLISILYALYIVIRNTKKYQYGGIAFLIMIAAFLLFGIVVQLCDSDLKVDYITISIALVMLYVFTLEMIQQTDELTGLINRRGYENYVSHIEDSSIILIFDVDKFKAVNDTYGHPFGDLCLKKVGSAIKSTYAKYGKCFRIGGDEFCAILTKNLPHIEEINSEFFNRMEQFRNNESRLPFVSIGYTFFDPQINNLQDALWEADKMIYNYKEMHRKEF